MNTRPNRVLPVVDVGLDGLNFSHRRSSHEFEGLSREGRGNSGVLLMVPNRIPTEGAGRPAW